MKHKWMAIMIVLWMCPLHSYGTEALFAGYFDIQTSRLAGEPVFGKINVKTIGALGRSYALSEKYGRKSANGQRLKKILYQTIIQYANHIPVLPQDVSVNGKPLGTELGDGFALLKDHQIITHGLATHQRKVTDALIFPMVNLMPDLLEDM